MKQGAGRKPQDNHLIVGELYRKQILCDQESLDILAKIGNGELSLGIREAARRLSAEGNDKGFVGLPKEE